MITECEMFVINSISLDNYIEYFHYGRLLSSDIVNDTVWNFILKHCNFFFETSFFLELPFNDVLNLVKSQDLAPKSEDEVLNAIVKWVEYKPNMKLQNDDNCLQVAKDNIRTMSSNCSLNANEISNTIDKVTSGRTTYISEQISFQNVVQYDNSAKLEKQENRQETLSESNFIKQYFIQLLTHSRACLASLDCLSMLKCHPLVNENKEAKDVITRAISYKVGKIKGQWPKVATYRNNSVCRNAAINFQNNAKLLVYTFSKNTWSEHICIGLFNQNIIIRLMSVGETLFYFYITDYSNEWKNRALSIGCLTSTWPLMRVSINLDRALSIGCLTSTWPLMRVSLNLDRAIFSVVGVNEFVFILQRKNFWKLNPLSIPLPVQLPDMPVDQPMCHVTVYDQMILAFNSLPTDGGVEETMVLCFDTSNNTWTRLNNLEGPADGMTSFKDDHSTYLLQSNGDMWKLVKPQSGVVDFEFVIKLWRSHWPLHGAVTFLDDLYIYGTKSETLKDDPQLQRSVAGLFRKVIYMESPDSDCTKAFFVPFILSASVQWQ